MPHAVACDRSRDDRMPWICPLAFGLDRQGVPVATRISAGHEHSGFRVAGDSLAAADDPGPVVDRVDVVPAPGEPRARLYRYPRLRVDKTIAVHAHARRLDGLLDVHAELEHVEEHLWRRLEDSVRARRPDGEAEDAVAEDLSGRHHGAGLPPGPHHVRGPGIAIHPLENVVEDDSGARDGEPRSERHAQGLGHGDDGTGGVRAGEVGGVLVREARGMALGDLPRERLGIVALALANRRTLVV